MILLDERIGSKELLPLFRPYDVPVQLGHLDYGDAMWIGNGPTGPESIAVERKTLHDLVSSMRSNRLSGHQLPGLLDNYNWVYLLVEGVWRAGGTGVTEFLYGRDWRAMSIGSRPVLYREIDHYIATLQHICTINLITTSNPTQTVAFIVSRYKWWEKEWTKHDSHTAIYAPYEAQQSSRRGSLIRRSVGLVEKVAAQLPGIDRKAYDVGRYFRTVKRLANAEVKEWEKVKGVGKKGAERIYNLINGE